MTEAVKNFMNPESISDKSFGETLTSLVPYVYATAYKITGGPSIAEDLAQNTLLDAWEKRHQLSDPSKIRSWLRAICVNRLLMEKRRAGNTLLSLDELTEITREGSSFEPVELSPSAEDELIAEESVRNIRNGCFTAMSRKLTLTQRTVFSLVDMFGMSIEETAQLLDITVPAVKGLLHRARKHLFNFFDTRCEWIVPEGHCHCAAWIGFTGQKTDIKDRARQRTIIDSFGEKPSDVDHSSAVRERILSIYRAIPDIAPPQTWYDLVIESITKKIS
jgi:RNA polymerase sigma-70 factor (ECF subfamily)